MEAVSTNVAAFPVSGKDTKSFEDAISYFMKQFDNSLTYIISGGFTTSFLS